VLPHDPGRDAIAHITIEEDVVTVGAQPSEHLHGPREVSTRVAEEHPRHNHIPSSTRDTLGDAQGLATADLIFVRHLSEAHRFATGALTTTQ
jgi:hypothetical protein